VCVCVFVGVGVCACVCVRVCACVCVCPSEVGVCLSDAADAEFAGRLEHLRDQRRV